MSPVRMKPAHLAGISGAGLVTVERNQRGEIVEAIGTWHPNGTVLDEHSLEQTLQVGHTVPYHGTLVDPRGGNTVLDEVKIQVTIVSISEDRSRATRPRTLVNFVSREAM